jgi:hypothetical protein
MWIDCVNFDDRFRSALKDILDLAANCRGRPFLGAEDADCKRATQEERNLQDCC